jgi:ketosteroid isomerase-like protein
MQPAPNVEQQTTAQVLTELLSLVGKDVQACADLFAEDAVIEFPYASGTPASGRVEGKEAIYDYMKTALAQIQDLRSTNIRV